MQLEDHLEDDDPHFQDGAQSVGGAPCNPEVYGLDSTGVDFKPHSPGSPQKGKTPDRTPKRRPRAGAMVLGNPYEGAGNNNIIMRRREKEIQNKNAMVLDGITKASSRYSRDIMKVRCTRVRAGIGVMR